MIDNKQCPAHTRTPWGDSDHRYDYRLRYVVMGTLTAIFIGVVVAAIVFLVDRKNHDWAQIGIDSDNWTHVIKGVDEPDSPFHPPFRACGDQLEDCQLFNKPFFCCPPTMLCHESKWSPSGLYCCDDEEKCIVSKEHIPSCIGKTTGCGQELGGGCCPHGTTCSPNGCLETIPGAASFPRMLMSLNLTLDPFGLPLNQTLDHHVLGWNKTLTDSDARMNDTAG
ncbi:Fc.00g003050.m01.CDS01 [Cosmosporella sp. VM-42]